MSGDLAHHGVMKAFVHEAVLELDGDSDPDAPGAAITIRVCGSTDHAGPCPLAPHNIHRTGEGRELSVRIVFAADPAQERHVRTLIRDALRDGHLTGPDGRASSWRLIHHDRSTLRAEEESLATRLAASNDPTSR